MNVWVSGIDKYSLSRIYVSNCIYININKFVSNTHLLFIGDFNINIFNINNNNKYFLNIINSLGYINKSTNTLWQYFKSIDW